jgi:heat shock protein HtpX
MALGKLKFAMFATFVLLFGTVLALTGLVVWIISPGIYASSIFLWIGMLLGFTIFMTLLQYALGPYIIRAFTNMKEMDEKEYKWIYEMVDDIANKAGLKKRPRLYIVHDGTPNAFAFGYSKNHAFLALHTGLIEMLNKDEIRAVVGHEMGHIKHNDVVLITIASMVPVFVYYLIVAIGSLAARGRDDDSGAAPILVFIGAYIAQFFTMLIVLYLSRTREFYADAFGAAAASSKDMRTALAKITYGFPGISKTAGKKYEKTRAFYIADPIAASNEREQRDSELGKELEHSAEKREQEGRHLEGSKQIQEAMNWERTAAGAKVMNIFSTHPLTYKRIDSLFEIEKEVRDADLSRI